MIWMSTCASEPYRCVLAGMPSHAAAYAVTKHVRDISAHRRVLLAVCHLGFMHDVQVNAIVFVGIGLLLTFLRRYSYSALTLTLLGGTLAVLLGIIVMGLVQQGGRGWAGKVQLDLPLFINANFVACAAIISIGAFIGKATPTQVQRSLARQSPRLPAGWMQGANAEDMLMICATAYYCQICSALHCKAGLSQQCMALHVLRYALRAGVSALQQPAPSATSAQYTQPCCCWVACPVYVQEIWRWPESIIFSHAWLLCACSLSGYACWKCPHMLSASISYMMSPRALMLVAQSQYMLLAPTTASLPATSFPSVPLAEHTPRTEHHTLQTSSQCSPACVCLSLMAAPAASLPCPLGSCSSGPPALWQHLLKLADCNVLLQAWYVSQQNLAKRCHRPAVGPLEHPEICRALCFSGC